MSNFKEEVLDPLPGTLLRRIRITYIPTNLTVEGVAKNDTSWDMYTLRHKLRNEIITRLKLKNGRR
jgi:hypothetical protein